MTSVLPLLLFVACVASLNSQAASMTDEVPENGEDVQGTIDEIIVKAANSSHQFEFFYDDEGTSMVRVEYDMLFTAEQYAEKQQLNNETDSKSRRKRTSGIINGQYEGWRWTNYTVPYQMTLDTFTTHEMNQILAAINDWENNTCLEFKQQNTGNRIHFQDGLGCSSHVGMVGGAQKLGLGFACRSKGIIIHEIGHALGLLHEQNKPDRDNYVRIIMENIPPNEQYNFEKDSWQTVLNLSVPYDYTSIMHYGQYAFSYTGNVTIETIDPKYQDVIGNRKGLSFRDIKTVNLMYNCKRHKPGCTKEDSDCPGEGFVGKDCRCWCPSGSLSNPTIYCPIDEGKGMKQTRPETKEPLTPRPGIKQSVTNMS